MAHCQKYARVIVIFVLFVSMLVVQRCDEPAITEPVASPDEIRPEILLTRTMNNENGQTKSEIRVLLRDKRDNIVEIDSGRVMVNNELMSPPENALFGTQRNYYYSALPVQANSNYEITVVLSSGDEAKAWVKAPSNELSQVMIPDEQRDGTDMTVRWLDTSYQYPQYIALRRMSSNGTFSETSETLFYNRYPYKGEFTIKGRYINFQDDYEGEYNEHRVYVIAQNEGALSEDFLEGGTIKCQLRIYQDFHIYE